MSQIRQVFEQHTKGLRLDRDFFKLVIAMESGFVNKKQEHIEFFGGATYGVQVVRFTRLETDILFVDVLEVDEETLKEDLYALRDTTKNPPQPVINQDWLVSRDVFNLSSIWLIHALHHAKSLTHEQRQEAKIRVCMYLLYKFMTSRMYKHFRFPADPEIAAATYSQLSGKYSIKALGSWGAVIRDLATKAVSEKGIWAETIDKMDVDYDVILMINDIQGRIRGMLRNVYDKHKQCLAQGMRQVRSSASIEIDGESILKDRTNSLSRYTRYLYSVISDRETFIRQELVDAVCSMMSTMNPKHLQQALVWTSNNVNQTRDHLVERCVDLTMEHAFEYLQAHRDLARYPSDLPEICAKLRGAYTSSRSVDPKLMTLRTDVEKLVTHATNSRNTSALASARTGWMLYVTLRAWSMRHYSNK